MAKTTGKRLQFAHYPKVGSTLKVGGKHRKVAEIDKVKGRVKFDPIPEKKRNPKVELAAEAKRERRRARSGGASS